MTVPTSAARSDGRTTVMALSKREAMRRAKVAVLDMLEQTAAEALNHTDAMTQALADNALLDSLAHRWGLRRVGRE
jgi:hypothetical protein